MTNQTVFKKKISQNVLLLLISLILLFLNSLNLINPVYSGISYLINPFKYIVWTSSKSFNDFTTTIANLSKLKKQNDALNKQNSDLLDKISQLKVFEEENIYLKEQLKLQDSEKYTIVEAKVIGSYIHENGTIQINQGSNSKITPDNIVVVGNQAVGIVKSVISNSAVIYVIIGPESNIPVYGQTNKAFGLVKGTIQDKLQMTNILPTEKIEVDEIVLTSGKNSPYPPDLIVGKILSVNEKDTAVTKDALIEPVIKYDTLDYVFILIPK